MTKAVELLEDVRDAYVVGDSAYSAAPLVTLLTAKNCTVVLAKNPTHKSRRDEEFDRHLYRERCLVEHFFQRIKRHRRIAMRFDKLARNFLAFLHLAAALVWLV
jgi:transposase